MPECVWPWLNQNPFPIAPLAIQVDEERIARRVAELLKEEFVKLLRTEQP